MKTFLAIMIVIVCSTSVHAQRGDRASVVVDAAPLVLLPDARRVPLRVLERGTPLVVVADEGEWLRVEFQDPQLGMRVGYIQSKFVSVQRSSGQSAPQNLSVPRVPAGAEPAAPPPTAARPQLPPVAQEFASTTPSRVFLDFNWISFHPREADETYVFTRSLFGETAGGGASYLPLPSIRDFLFIPSVAIGFGNGAYIGGRVTVPEYDRLAAVLVNIPHPSISNRFGTDSSASGLLRRQDILVDVMLGYAHNAPRWRVVAFAGPTFFRSKQEMVSAINYSQFTNLLGLNSIVVTGTDEEEVTDTGWGGNVGFDVSYFLWRHIGAGGGIHFNRGQVSMAAEPLSREAADLQVGSVTYLVGARFRF